MFEDSRTFARIVVSLLVAAVLTLVLCHLWERVERQPGTEVLSMAQAD
jgi:hypothetical protein